MGNTGKKKQKTVAHPKHTRRDALDCIPEKNSQIEEKADSEGDLLLSYQVQVKPWFQGVFKKITKSKNTLVTRKLQLDTLGTSVWQMIDGRKSVKQIIREFQELHKLNSREAEISVTSFLKELGKRGLLAMKVK